MKLRNFYIEIHTLRQTGVNGLNYQADSSGSLKTATFGQVLRQRVSSQAQKYDVREEIGNLYQDKAERTKGAYNAAVERLMTPEGDEATAKQLAFGAFALMSFTVDEYGRTGDKLPYTDEGMTRFVGVIRSNQPALLEVKEVEETSPSRYRKRVAQGDKAVMKKQALALELSDALFGPTNAELALLGRPLFKLPERQQYGALQVAHALGVAGAHPVYDHFSSKDTYEQGRFATNHRDVTQFMSSTLYAYSTIDLLLLVENLGGDVDKAVEVALVAVDYTLRLFPNHRAAETGQYLLPFYTMLTAGSSSSPLNLVGAFDKPVWSTEGEQVGAVTAIEEHWRKMHRMWGPQLAQFTVRRSIHLPEHEGEDVHPNRQDSALEELEQWLNRHKQTLREATRHAPRTVTG